MSVALTYSVAGMQAAANRMAIRSRNVANVQTPGYQAAEVVQKATGSGPVVSAREPISQSPVLAQSQQVPPEPSSEPPSGVPLAPPSDVSLEYELTDMLAAKHAYKASAAVTRTVSDMQDALLDIFV